MADQKDQTPKPPSQSSGLPFKKRDFAEKTLPGSDRAAETMPSNSNYDDFFFPMNKKMNLDELQKLAYYNVLHAFKAESYAISSSRITIIKDLKKEWKIDLKTHTAFEDKLKSDPLVQQFRDVSLPSDEKEDTDAEERRITAVEGSPLKFRLKVSKEDVLKFQERLNIAPAKMQKDKAEPSSTSDDLLIPGWGQVSPASLVNRWISIRMPGEDDYIAYLIKEYDAETEMHHLVSALSKKDLDDPCNWIDLRHFPTEDVVWQEGNPGFPTRKCSLKPGETVLHATSTARETRKIKEVGKTASGIPIIKKLDKGKGIA